MSLSGLSLADNLEMLKRVSAAKNEGAHISAVELNLACPNIKDKPVVAYDFAQMADVLDQVLAQPEFKSTGLPLGVKLAPYLDITQFGRCADIINARSDRIKFVVTMNTIGNALAIDTETEMAMIAPREGLGGLGGGPVRNVALANVKLLRQKLVKEVDIIGVGGVSTGEHAFQLILCGASAVQSATTHWMEGAGCFDRIAKELETLMSKKGYSSIKDFQGSLKDYDKVEGKKIATNSVYASKPSKNGMVTNALFVIMGIVLSVMLQFILDK